MFDSPLFWIVAIWWLLSTFLGAKARKRRRAAVEMAASEPEEPVPPGPRETPESEPAVAPLETPDVIPATPVAPPPPPPAQTVTPLQEIFHALGMEQRPPLFGALRAAPEPEIIPVEAETPLVEPAKLPPPREAPAISHRPKAKSRPHYPVLPLASLERLTPWQQALVLKEILDSPLAVRSRT